MQVDKQPAAAVVVVTQQQQQPECIPLLDYITNIMKFVEAILGELRRASIVRSQRGAEGGYALARSIYDALHCLDGVTLDGGGPDEVHVIGCTAQQSDPIPLGPDALERPEWSLNFQLRTHSPTPHRPA